MPRLKPGSRASRIVATAGRLAKELGRGATIAEMRVAYPLHHDEPAPGSLTSEVVSLAKRGVLERTGGRAGHTLYAPPGAGVSGRERNDDNALVVLQALRSVYRRLRRPVSTREVTRELRRLGLSLVDENLNTVKKALETLSVVRERGPEGFRPAQVIRVAPAPGKAVRSAHWIPSGARPSAPAAPRSRADAVRTLIEMGQVDLHRPVSRTELRWLVGTPRGRAVLPPGKAGGSLSGDLKRLARHEAAYAWELGRIHTVRTPLTCFGGPPPRYLAEPPTPGDRAVCAIEDVLSAFRPADEVHGATVLRRRAEMARSDARRVLADLRQDVLRAAVVEAADGFPDLGHLVHRGRLASAAYRTWLDAAASTLSPDQVDGRRRIIRERDFQLDAMDRLVRDAIPTPDAPWKRVGQAAVIGRDEAGWLIDLAGEHLEIPDRSRNGLLDRVRRLPAFSRERHHFGMAGAPPLAFLDRVDLFTELWAQMPVSRANALLADAGLLLGHVLRDLELVESLLRVSDKFRAGDRRGLVVAAGLLGGIEAIDAYALDPRDQDDVSAWVLGAVLATAGRAEPILSQALGTLGGSARRTVDRALFRLEAGYVFSAIE